LATVTAKPEFAPDVEGALKKMIPASLAEAGCISYALFRSEDQAGVFHLAETYADDTALEAHHESAHFSELVASLANKLLCDIQIEHVTAL
jgi:quinol monooxygenase YgiN